MMQREVITSDPAVSVATDALRAEAEVWEQQSGTLRTAAAKAQTLRISPYEAGVLALLLRAYGQVIDVVSGRCGEGADRTTEIGAALRRVADVYDDEERNNVHRLTNLY